MTYHDWLVATAWTLSIALGVLAGTFLGVQMATRAARRERQRQTRNAFGPDTKWGSTRDYWQREDGK